MERKYTNAHSRFGDGENYNHSKVSVFEPEDALDKLKNEIVPYFNNFLN